MTPATKAAAKAATHPKTDKPRAGRADGKPHGNSRARKGGLGARARFLVEFITHPTMIGAFAPSSKHLAHEMLKTIDLSGPIAVAEYGPGTGAFTRAILERMGPKTKFFAVERNEGLVKELRTAMPQLKLYEGSVEHIEEYCRQEGVQQLDAIVCGLPWASFPESLQRRILEATIRVLKPGGQMVCFGYHIGLLTPAGKRFYRILPEYFKTNRRSKPVWRNAPPAFVLRCTK